MAPGKNVNEGKPESSIQVRVVDRSGKWHTTYEVAPKANTKSMTTPKEKTQVKDLINEWKDCPESIDDNASTKRNPLTYSKGFRIDLQGTFQRKQTRSRQANIQVQRNATDSHLIKSKKKRCGQRESTTVSTLILPCGEKVGQAMIKRALIFGLDDDKDIMFIRTRTGVANGTRSITSCNAKNAKNTKNANNTKNTKGESVQPAPADLPDDLPMSQDEQWQSQ